jgi:hypothetical protein
MVDYRWSVEAVRIISAGMVAVRVPGAAIGADAAGVPSAIGAADGTIGSAPGPPPDERAAAAIAEIPAVESA